MEGKQVQVQIPNVVQKHNLVEDLTIEQEELKKAEQLKQEVIEIVDFTNKIRESLRKANNDLSTVDDELRSGPIFKVPIPFPSRSPPVPGPFPN